MKHNWLVWSVAAGSFAAPVLAQTAGNLQVVPRPVFEVGDLQNAEIPPTDLPAANGPIANGPGAPETPTTIPDAAELSLLIRGLVLEHLPLEYENTKNWGRTKEVWDGVRISFDGGRLKTKRRKKQANHGTWKKYNAWLIEPDKNLTLRISDLRQTDSGRAAFNLTVGARLGAFGRLSEWRNDVQLYSFGVHAETRVTLLLRCELGFALDFKNFPPDLLLDPVVQETDLYLDEFRLLRVSNLHGPLVKHFGSNLHDVLQDELDQRREKLTSRINRQIDKQRNKMRLSLTELLRWENAEALLKESGIESDSDLLRTPLNPPATEAGTPGD